MKSILPFILLLFFFACKPLPETAEKGESPDTPPEEMVPYTDPNEQLQEMGIVLPLIGRPVGNYVNVVRTGNLLYTAGKVPIDSAGNYIKGKLGKDLTVEEGYEAARLTGLQLLSVLEFELGNLDRVNRIVKVIGMVNATPDFTAHAQVINGFSDLMVDVFGDKGRHARAAVGMGSLPANFAVEIEMIVEVKE